jgi:ABC-type Fe3+ transport system permease subunit
MKKFKAVLAIGAVVAGVGLAALPTPTFADDLTLGGAVSSDNQGQGQPTSLFGGSNAIVPRVINIMLYIVGILAIIMLIYGGIRYVLSGGDDKRVTAAKNTILYAIVGLIVAILGYAVVNWIVKNLGGSSDSDGTV